MQELRPFAASKIPPLIRPEFWQHLPKPFDVEIGSGCGHFAIQRCLQRPDRNLLAFERTHNKYSKMEHNISKACGQGSNLANLWPVHGDAVHWLSQFCEPGDIHDVFVMYPNPYLKSSQKNLRWGHMSFLTQLEKLMTSDGRFHYASNIAMLAEETSDRFLQRGWRLEHKKVLARSCEPRTLFEKKYLLRGETCHDLVFSFR